LPRCLYIIEHAESTARPLDCLNCFALALLLRASVGEGRRGLMSERVGQRGKRGEWAVRNGRGGGDLTSLRQKRKGPSKLLEINSRKDVDSDLEKGVLNLGRRRYVLQREGGEVGVEKDTSMMLQCCLIGGQPHPTYLNPHRVGQDVRSHFFRACPLEELPKREL